MIKLYMYIAILLAFVALIRTPRFKGWFGETTLRLAVWLRLDKKTYHMVNNVILPAGNGTTQIDHVIVSRFGIFVVEVKAMKGAIFGSEHDQHWTQAIGPKKYQFMNPLHQNYKHTTTLAEVIEVPHEKMKSVVMLIGNAKLKTGDKLPSNVLTHRFVPFIKSHTQEILTKEEVSTALKRIEERRVAPSLWSNQQHIRNVKNLVAGKQRATAERVSKATAEPVQPVVGAPPPPPAVAIVSDTTEPSACPKCGKPMVLRTAKRGQNVGQQFWGCRDYPRCQSMMPMG